MDAVDQQTQIINFLAAEQGNHEWSTKKHLSYTLFDKKKNTSLTIHEWPFKNSTQIQQSSMIHQLIAEKTTTF